VEIVAHDTDCSVVPFVAGKRNSGGACRPTSLKEEYRNWAIHFTAIRFALVR
jgi:hypothetical protein